jgi:peptidylprolyl isomerase
MARAAREERIKARQAKTFRRRILAIAVIIVVVVALVLLYQYGRQPPAASNLTKVIVKTSMGDITIELFDDMPITTNNFEDLVSRGIYDGTIFHRVIDGFMIQGGDPTGTGYGDPSIPAIQDEFTDHNRNDRGTVAMANSGPNTGSSQFFINLVNNDHLNTLHPVFGRVIAGMDIVDAIGKVQTDENDRPLTQVMIFEAELVEP